MRLARSPIRPVDPARPAGRRPAGGLRQRVELEPRRAAANQSGSASASQDRDRVRRRRGGRRSLLISGASTLIVLGGLAALIITSPGWHALRTTFFSWSAFRSSFGQVL